MKKKIMMSILVAFLFGGAIISSIYSLGSKEDRLTSEMIASLRNDYPDYKDEFYASYEYVIDPIAVTYEQIFASDGDHLAIIVCTVSGEITSYEDELYAVGKMEESEESTSRFQNIDKKYQIPVKVDEVIMSSEPITSDEITLLCTKSNFLAIEQFQVGKKFVLCMGKYSNSDQYGPSLPLSYYLYEDEYLIPLISDTKGRNIEGISLDSYRDMIHEILEE